VTGALVMPEVTDVGLRRWWAFHALTTDTVAGLLVLLITVLVADQVVRLRQISGRARAVAAQAAIQDRIDTAAPGPRPRDAIGRPGRPIRLTRLSCPR